MSDPLHDRLSGLAADLDRVTLADSPDVRRRGDRRTRRQALGGTVAGVAALGLVGALAVSAFGFDGEVAPSVVADRPAASAPPAVSPPMIESVEPALVEALADDPLVEAPRLGRFGVYGALALSPEAPQVPPLCVTDPAALGADETVAGLFYDTEIGEATVSQWVLRFDSPVAAERAVERLGKESRSGCEVSTTEDDDFVSEIRGPLDGGAGDQSFVTSVATRPKPEAPAAGLLFEEIAVAREANVVTVLSWRAMGDPYDGARPVFDAERLELALDTATPSP